MGNDDMIDRLEIAEVGIAEAKAKLLEIKVREAESRLETSNVRVVYEYEIGNRRMRREASADVPLDSLEETAKQLLRACLCSAENS